MVRLPRFLILGLLAFSLGYVGVNTTACIHQQPPAGTYSAQGLKAFNADNFVKDLTALSQTAINLNATTGREHLSDQDTRYVRDFALAAGQAANAYGSGTGTVANLKATYTTLNASLSVDARANSKLVAALQIIQNALNALPAQ